MITTSKSGMRVLAIAHGLKRGGAQEATLEMLDMLKRRNIEVKVITSDAANKSFLSGIEELGIVTFGVPHKLHGNYPDLEVERCAELIKSSDVVWITDVEYLVAPRIKRIKADVPVIAHITSNALACPESNAAYGMRETCTLNCSRSLLRFSRCKQLSKQYLVSLGWGGRKMKIYQLLNFPKSVVDFINWPLREDVFENIDCFMALSEFTRDLMRIHLPQIKEIPIEVVPNPVVMPDPIRPLVSDVQGKSILYPSGPGIHKGPHIVLNVTKTLLDEGLEELTLTMLGVEGDTWINNIVRQLHIGKHVRLLPKLPRRQVLSLMAGSAVALMPFLTPEPFPRVAVEANLVGTPVVVSNRGALPSLIVDKVTGLVTEPTVEEFAKSVDEALRTDWDRDLIVRNTRERFDPEKSTDKLVQALTSVSTKVSKR
jgi:glycosyltransferase involved in cell wall biosynthesis